MSGRGGDGAGMDVRRRVGSCGGRRDGAGALPEGGCQLGAGGVRGAHEHDPGGGGDRRGEQPVERFALQPQVAAAPVTFRTAACQQARRLEDAEVMGQQVGGHVEQLAQLRGGRVTEAKLVHDQQPVRV